MNSPYIINKNTYSITVYSNGIKFDGEFYYVYNREIVRANTNEDFIDFKDYIGSNYLKIRSEKKLSQAILPYFLISVIKSVCNIISNTKDTVMSNFNQVVGMSDLNQAQEYMDKFNTAKEIISDTSGNELSQYVSDKVMEFINGFLPFPIPPSGINILFWILQIIALILFIRYFLSNTNVYEFSAVNKRIAVDMSSISKEEYMNLLYVIKENNR